MSSYATSIDPQQRTTLKALADVLLPAEDEMPSASEANVHGEFLDRVLQSRPDLRETLSRVLDEAAGREPEAEIRRIKTEDRAGFLALASACAGGYYLNQGVRDRIGYPGQQPSLPDAGEAEADLSGDILAPVIARGRFTRDSQI